MVIVATDASGNRSEAASVLSLEWIRKSFTAEYGVEITREDLLLEPDPDHELLTDRQLADLNRAKSLLQRALASTPPPAPSTD